MSKDNTKVIVTVIVLVLIGYFLIKSHHQDAANDAAATGATATS